MADYILVVQLDVPEAHDAEFNRLYDGEHVPNLLSVPGVVSGQRYKLEGDGEDMLRYLATYEIESPDIPSSDEWQKKANTEGWVTVREHVTARRRGVFRKI
ncbi:MAG: hypothetical protein MJE12_06175 [Alphaproteobacteria bacterium]|nr:hypothetical protein [Alphaproteobacteria bacterium]